MLIPHTYGTSNHAPLLLLHPGGALHSVWMPLIRRWQDRFYILAPDLVPDLSAPVPLQDLAHAIGGWLDHLNVIQIDVVGASLGANVALQLAIDDPSRIHHLVLDSGQPGQVPPPIPLIILPKILRGMFAVLPQSLITRGLMSQFKGYSAVDQHAIRDEMLRLGKYGFIESIEAHLSHDVGSRLPHITASTLILEGRDDMLTKQGMGEALQRGIANAQRETIPDAGHVTFLSQIERFQKQVEQFLVH